MLPSYVKAYVKRGKSDLRDAEAVCEAVQRPSMRFVPKSKNSVEQQVARLGWNAPRSAGQAAHAGLANAVRGLLAEQGIITAHVGREGWRLRDAGGQDRCRGQCHSQAGLLTALKPLGRGSGVPC